MSDNPAGAPYGHACAHCVRSKTKCVVRSGSSTCERCHRSGRPCLPASQHRKRGVGVKKAPSTGKISQIEDKLDDLVSLLRSQNSSLANSPNEAVESVTPDHIELEKSPPASPHFLPGHFASVWLPKEKDDTETQSGSEAAPSYTPRFRSILADPATNTNTRQVTPHSPGATDNFEENPERDFEIFRTQHLKAYPFMYIPPTTTAEEFRRTRPFLWINVQAIFSSSLRRGSERGRQIREQIAHRVIVEGERSIELLLGTLMHGAWAHLFSHSKRPFGGILSNIARTLVADLKLDAIGPDREAPVRPFTPPSGQYNPWRLPSGSYEERRALLACFVTSASMSELLRYECLRWGAKMDHCAQQLSSHPECPEDRVLVAIARISRVSSDAAKVMRRADEEATSVLLHIMPLKAALDGVKATLSEALLTNKIVLSFLHHAETMIHEIALYQKPSSPTDHAFSFRRPEYLYSCIQSCKLVIENHISFDMPLYTANSMYENLHLMHAVQTLHRLSLLDEPGWDRVAVRKMADVMAYLEQLVTKLENAHAHTAIEFGVEHSIWLRGSRRLKLALPKWGAGLDDPTPTLPQENFDFDPMTLDLGDDAWYTEFFSTLP